ncbi:hypothetical protein TRFO_05806 [Tritrichomonas foetus]|uniref:Uncharacterized protein n=1 Tax=Tritrichomonas foetus TaxID=1144522 RepID=A0A1J4K8B5_9EUKA|nr:hypothetical protein TRFO_05806 [Tritrichomonas foetus]|eukprot:OHT05677.1 hypothetical protein TRFO_05806 [Tritrichomonas foetus]
MDQVSQVEQQVFAALGTSEQITDEIRVAAQKNLIQMYKNLDILIFFLSNYNNFTFPTSKLFALNLINFWVKEKFTEMSPESISMTQQFLFSTMLASFNELTPDLIEQLIPAQSQLMLKIFPNPWSEFFGFLFQQNDNFVKQFLSIFCKDLCVYIPSTYQQIVEVRSHIRQTGLCDQIFQYALKKITENDIFGYNILSTVVSICPFKHLCDPNFHSVLMNGLANPIDLNCIVYIFNTLENIVKHPMEKEVKTHLIQTLINPANITNIIKSANNVEIYTSAAKLINTVSVYWQAFNCGPDYFIIGLNFIQLDDSTASLVLNSVFSAMMKWPEVNDEAVKALINRIIANFSSPNILDNFSKIANSCERYSNVILATIGRPQNHVLEIITSFVPSFNFVENPGICSAMIFLVNQILKSPYSSILGPVLLDFRNLFAGILQFNPPFSPNQMVCMFYYSSIMSDKPGIIINSMEGNIKFVTDEEASRVCAINMQLAFQDNVSQSLKTKLLSKLPKYSFKKTDQRLLQFDQNIINTYVQSLKPLYTSAISQVIRYADKSLGTMIDQQFFQFAMQALSQNPPIESINSILSYISSAQNNDPAVIAACQEIVQQVKSNTSILENDESLASLIKAFEFAFAKEAVQHCIDIIQYIKGPSSVAAFCVLFFKFYQPYESFIPQVLTHLFNVIKLIIDDFIVKSSLKINDMYSVMAIKEFLLTTSKILKTLYDWNKCDIVVSVLPQFVPLLQFIFDKYYFIPTICFNCIDSLTTLYTVKNLSGAYYEMMGHVYQTFLSSSLNIVFIESVDYASDIWRAIIKKIYAFHNALNSLFKHDSNFIGEKFVQLGAPPEMDKRYISISDLENSMKSEHLRQFFHDLSLYFHEIDI